MSVDLSRLTTVAAIDSAIADAQSRKGELVFRQTLAQRQLENIGDVTDLPEKLLRNGYELNAAIANVENATTDSERAYWQNQVTIHTNAKIKLESRAENASVESIQALLAKIGEYPLLVVHYDQYIADLEAKKATL
jgi:hypothetical protein